MDKYNEQVFSSIMDEFRLAALPDLADLKALARRWGITSIEERDIESEAMLLPNKDGYSIVLKKVNSAGQLARQRFSLAHELGHLLLQKSEPRGSVGVPMKHRDHGHSNEEERLCDQIAAEILMPRLTFEEDGWMEGWSVRNVRLLASKYNTSVTATARRMIDLMPDEAIMGVWKVSGEDGKAELQWSHAGKTSYAIPATQIVAEERLELINQAWNSYQYRVVEGVAPVKLGRRKPVDVPAEAMTWGRDEYKQVMVYYYPGREQESKVG